MAALFLLASCTSAEVPTVRSLERQLAGEHCRFEFSDKRGCMVRDTGIWERLLREPHQCDVAAVACLSRIRTPEAHEALIGVLKTKKNVHTCDGRYLIRTHAVEALGDSGYEPAIAALISYRDSKPVERLSSGASGCEASPEPLDVVERALERLRSVN